MGLVRRSAQRAEKGSDQSRHQKKYRDKAAKYTLGEHQTEVIAQPELHEHQRNKTGDRRKARGGNFNDGFGKRFDQRLAFRWEAVDLILIAMGENDGVVDGERELQNNGNGIGDGGYLAQPEVCAHIEQRRNRKDDKKNDDLEIAARRKEQHRHDDHRRQRHDTDHLLRDLPKEVRADVRGGICIKACCERTDLVHRRNDVFIVACAVKGDREQRCGIHKMRWRIIKRHAGHMLECLNLLRSGTRTLIGRIGKHNVGACIRRELVLHDREPAAGETRLYRYSHARG